MVIGAIPQTDRLESRKRTLAALGRLQTAAIKQRQLDVVECRGAGQQVETLEHEADLRVANVGKRILRHPRDVFSVEKILTRRRPVETPDDVHEG